MSPVASQGTKRPLSPASPRLGLKRYDRSARRRARAGYDRYFDEEPWLSDPDPDDPESGDRGEGPSASQIIDVDASAEDDAAAEVERRSSRSTPTASSPVRAPARSGARQRPAIDPDLAARDAPESSAAAFGEEPPTPTRASHLRASSMAPSASRASASSFASDATDSSGPTGEQARAWAYGQAGGHTGSRGA